MVVGRLSYKSAPHTNNGVKGKILGSLSGGYQTGYSVYLISLVNDEQLSSEIKTILDLQLNNNCKAVLFKDDLENQRIASLEKPLAAQQAIYDYVKRL